MFVNSVHCCSGNGFYKSFTWAESAYDSELHLPRLGDRCKLHKSSETAFLACSTMKCPLFLNTLHSSLYQQYFTTSKKVLIFEETYSAWLMFQCYQNQI